MKRFILIATVLVIIFSLGACTIFPTYLVNIKAKDVVHLEMTRQSDGLNAAFENGDKSIVKVLNEINSVLFYKNTTCGSVEEAHAYTLTFTTEKQDYILTINEDGSVCYENEHYVVDFSSKTTLNLSIFDRMIDSANQPEEDKNAQEDVIEEKPIIEKEEQNIQEVDDSIVQVAESTDIAFENGTRYFIANALVLNQNLNILASEAEDGKITIYYNCDTSDTISYVDGSYEQSGGKMIYINVFSDVNGTRCYYLDLTTKKCSKLGEGNTSNILLFESPLSAIMGHGWIISEDYIIPIKLDSATPNSELLTCIKDDPKMNSINNHFFNKYIDGYDKKSVLLSALDNDKLIIQVTETSSEDLPDIVTEFTFSCIDKTIVQN